MTDDILNDADFETLAIRTGQLRTNMGSHSEPIFATSSFVFENAAQAAARFGGQEEGFIYSRFTNPTVAAFEERLAALEGGERCVAFASGMAAIQAVFMALLQSGDHIVCSQNVFGTTPVLINKFFVKFGVSVTFVSLTDLDAWRSAVTDQTKLLFLESPSNPLGEVADISAIADIAHESGAKLVVDNCLCTPALQQPLKLGADIIVHSATKYLDGQGRCVGGAVVSNKAIGEEIFGFLRSAGATLSPFNAWVFLKGLETLSLRMKAHCESALALAKWLDEHPSVSNVFYSGLPAHEQHELAGQQQSAYGCVLAFTVKAEAGKNAERKAAWQVIDHTKMLSITANLGDAKTTITHPASTTHGRLSDAEKEAFGISENLIRVAVGLESLEDIQADLALGLSAIA